MSVMPGPSGPGSGSGGGYQPRFGYAMKPRMPPPMPGGSGSGFGSGFGGSKFGSKPPNSGDHDRNVSVDNEDGDGKRPRKSQMRRTVDYRSVCLIRIDLQL